MKSNMNLQEYNDILEEIGRIEISSKEIEEIGEFKPDEDLGKLGEELFEKYFKLHFLIHFSQKL